MVYHQCRTQRHFHTVELVWVPKYAQIILGLTKDLRPGYKVHFELI